MYELFLDLMDKVNLESMPELYPEQVYKFINLSVNELELEAREAFELTSKLSDDVAPLVKRGFIDVATDNFYSYDAVRDNAGNTLKINYLLNASVSSGIGEKKGTSELVRVQQDDIRTTLSDPFQKPKYASILPFVIEENGLRVFPSPNLTLGKLTGRFIITHPTISDTQNCLFPQQLHPSIVKRAVELALDVIESPRVATFPKISK